VEYAVVVGYISHWSLHEMGLTMQQITDLMNEIQSRNKRRRLLTGEAPVIFHECDPALRQRLLTRALLRYTGQDLSNCHWKEEKEK
jgi:hypothetical protein